jgi:hypothetical protein
MAAARKAMRKWHVLFMKTIRQSQSGRDNRDFAGVQLGCEMDCQAILRTYLQREGSVGPTGHLFVDHLSSGQLSDG